MKRKLLVLVLMLGLMSTFSIAKESKEKTKIEKQEKKEKNREKNKEKDKKEDKTNTEITETADTVEAGVKSYHDR